MTGRAVTCRAPGKLYIAGEYAVVEPGRPAVLVAVQRYATVTISEAETALSPTTLRSDLFDEITVRCARIDGELVPLAADGAVRAGFAYLLSAVAIIDRLLAECGVPTRSFDLVVGSTLTDVDGRKFGLGSSAAVTVATIAALGAFYHLDLSTMDRFRLALLATAAAHPQCSGGDLAASTWGGWIAYTAPDRASVVANAAEHGVTAALTAQWPGLSIRELPEPTSIDLLVGWTGEPASTDAMVTGLGVPQRRTIEYRSEFLAASAECVQRLIAAIERDDPAGIQREVRGAKKLLGALDKAAGLGIFTRRLDLLCASAEKLGAAAKPSGAGGGDCGIALIDRRFACATAELRDRWVHDGIRMLPLGIHSNEGSRA